MNLRSCRCLSLSLTYTHTHTHTHTHVPLTVILSIAIMFTMCHTVSTVVSRSTLWWRGKRCYQTLASMELSGSCFERDTPSELSLSKLEAWCECCFQESMYAQLAACNHNYYWRGMGRELMVVLHFHFPMSLSSKHSDSCQYLNPIGQSIIWTQTDVSAILPKGSS